MYASQLLVVIRSVFLLDMKIIRAIICIRSVYYIICICIYI